MDSDEQLVLERRLGSDYALVYSIKNSAKAPVVAMSRTEYQAATPSTYLKSVASPHASFWALARKREVMSNLKLETMGPLLSCAPPGYTALPTAFVYRNKYNEDKGLLPGDLPEKSWKARVVVKGYMMIENKDYTDTFAPTASPTSIRLIAAIAANYGLPLKAADFETAFLNSPMDTTVYIKTPAGFEQWARHGLKGLEDLPKDFLPGDEAEPKGCRLLMKGIPGIKQGSRLFYQEQRKFWLAYGFKQLPADPCVFYRINADGLTLVAVWVDDLFAAVPSNKVWAEVVAEIRKKFPLADKGNATLFLGIAITQSEDLHTVTLSQRNSIEDLLERSDMVHCNPAQTPCVATQVWTKADCPAEIQRAHPEMPNFGGLSALALFISVWTRGEASFTVNKLCKFMSNPGDKHVAALKRLLRYFAGTKDHGLVYKGSSNSRGLFGSSDSSHMDCPDTSRSTLAFVFFFNDCVVSWYSKLHGFVTTCTNHSEYAALFMASKEAYFLIGWLRPMEEFLKLRLEPTEIFLDNDGAKALSQDPVGRNKNKHVRMAHHFTQELVAEGVITTVGVDTTENCADILTKALGPNVFPTHAVRLVGDTVAVQKPARVMMIRGVEKPVSADAQWRRPQRVVGARDVASKGTQCDLLADALPEVAHMFGRSYTNAYLVQTTEALDAARVYFAEVQETTVIMQAQNLRVKDAGRALHARLQNVLEDVTARLAAEEFKDYSYPGDHDEVSGNSGADSPELEDSPDPEFDERPLSLQAPPRLEDVPPGVLYVCADKPNARPCHSCMERCRCSVFKWNKYKTRPDISGGLTGPDGRKLAHITLTGLVQHVNLIVLGYLGSFCNATVVVHVNPPPREWWCNYCRVWGHQFRLDNCSLDAEQRLDVLHQLARRTRNVARLSWRGGSLHDEADHNSSSGSSNSSSSSSGSSNSSSSSSSSDAASPQAKRKRK
jgi:hypothetical protein